MKYKSLCNFQKQDGSPFLTNSLKFECKNDNFHIECIYLSSAFLVITGVFFLQNSISPETEVSRTNPIGSANESYSIEMPKRIDPVDTSNEPYAIVKAVEMPVVATNFVKVVSGNVTTVLVDKVRGTVVSPEPVPVDESSQSNAALVSLASLNAELAPVEKLTTRNALLPESAAIESAFATLNRESDTLKTKQLSEEERLRIRKSLQNSAADLFGRIGYGLNARQ